MRKNGLVGAGIVLVVGCSVAGQAEVPVRVPWAVPMDVATARALVANHHVFDATTARVVGGADTPDPRVQMQLLAAATPTTASLNGWTVATGAPVHTIGATYSESFASPSPNDLAFFAVDGKGVAARGIASGPSPATVPAAASGAAFFVLTNLYDGPDLAGYYFDSATDPGQGVSFGLSGLVLNILGTRVYALSAQGSLYCFTGFSGGAKTGPAGPLSLCDGGGHWPYSAGAGHTVSWSSIYPLYRADGDISAVYFGDDRGSVHCVNAVTYTDTSGASHAAGTSCWTGGPVASLVAPPDVPAPLDAPVVMFDDARGVPVVFIADDAGRVFRVIDSGTTPTIGPAIASQSLCGASSGACGAAPQRWSIRGGPAADYGNAHIYVLTAGTDGAGNAAGAIAAEFPVSASANWQVTTTPKTLTTAALNGPVMGGVTLDVTNHWLYASVHNSLYKAQYPFDGNATSGVYSTVLADSVTTAPPGFATDDFPIGTALAYYSPPAFTSVYVGNTDRVEEYGCQAAGQPPVLEGASASSYGGLIETGFILDWSHGNLYFGLDRSGAAKGGGFVQHPSTATTDAWACPGGTTASAAAACGAPGCAPSCGACASVSGDVVACDVTTGGVCVVKSCPPGRADCDNNAANGCEVDIESDVDNCGGCAAGAPPQVGSSHTGVLCSNANATPSCVGGACAAACKAGYSRCAGDAANDGCPVKATCGIPATGAGCCGSNCSAGQACGAVGGSGPSTCESSDLPVGCVTISEHATANLACEAPDQVITTIDFVSFGLPSGVCGAFATGAIPAGGAGTVGATCDAAYVRTAPLSSGTDGVLLDGTHAPAVETERQLVENQCLGRSSCTVLAESDLPQGPAPQRELGDPCPGNNKRLAVQFRCGCPQCVSDRDCGGAAPLCNTTAHVCGCRADSDCAGTPGKTRCNQATAQCVACADDTGCAAGTHCDSTPDGTPYGDATPGPLANTCAACVSNSNCSAPTPVCDTTGVSPAGYACVGCLQTADCASPVRYCDPKTRACVDCPGGTPCDGPPNVCGDGVLDPAKEQCDNGAANTDTAGPCSAACKVQDFLALSEAPVLLDGGPITTTSRSLGMGRHPLAAGNAGFAVALLEQTNAIQLRAEAFDLTGARKVSFPSVGLANQTTIASDPVVAALTGSSYAVLWTDFGGDGDDEGIALASLDAGTGKVGAVLHANETTSYAQHGADAVWTGGALVVAWTDESDPTTGADLKLRTFSPTLTPTSSEVALARTTATESDVALAVFNGSWAAAWRADTGGAETLHVKVASGAEYTVGPIAAGPTDERPALGQLGPTTLLLGFTTSFTAADGAASSKLQVTIVDTTQPSGSLTATDWPVGGRATDGTSLFPQASLVAVVVDGTAWVASWTGATAGDANGEELWAASVATTSVATGATVLPLPRQGTNRQGDQRRPALVTTALGANGGLVAAWEDYGGTLSAHGVKQDVVLTVAPLIAGGRGAGL